MNAPATHNTFVGARLLEPIDCRQHIQFIERRIAVKRLVNAPQRPRHIIGDVACREFAQTFPCPPSSYPTEEQNWIDWSLVMWAKSTKTHTTDQNHLCESRYNRHVFCSGKIPPANQTAAVWRLDIPRVPDVFPAPTLSELIQREKRLVREQRECRWLLSQIIGGYENDWRTQVEREDLLRASTKACRSAYGRVSFYFPTLKTGKLPRPSDDSLHEWNKILLEHSQSEKTPLNEEIDFYPPSSRENNADGRERSSDDEKVSDSGSEFDGINHEGMKESGSWQSNEQVEPVEEPHRERWLAPLRFLFNPQNNEWSEVQAEEIKSDPQFQTALVEHQMIFSDSTITELAEVLGLKPNTLSKRISRQEYTSMYPNVDIAGTTGNYFCIITLKGENSLKILGKADAPLAEVLNAFMDEWCASESNAIKQTRKNAKKTGADQQTREKMERDAREDIRAAYQVVISVLVPDAEGFGGTFYHFKGYEELLRASKYL
jgi:hypothetical protein